MDKRQSRAAHVPNFRVTLFTSRMLLDEQADVLGRWQVRYLTAGEIAPTSRVKRYGTLAKPVEP